MEHEMEFRDKVILITGAAGSIGKGIAKRFLSDGAKVFITDLDTEILKQAEQEMKDQGYLCQSMAADVTNHDHVKSVVQKPVDVFGGSIDVLINVAGIMAQTRVEDITEKEWDLVFDVNCKGTFYFVKEVVPIMKKQKSGSIVNFSSKSGKTGSALLSHYSAAKAAIIGFTQALAYELADFSINVNCICPGITEDTGVWDTASSGYIQNLGLSKEDVVDKFTSKVPLKRLARIEDIVAVTYFLSSKGADYMTGQAINVTGGREMH
jgi:NAD(P)-dependent dehydrogenase (short-subunit alcohol dehydrogenase family)